MKGQVMSAEEILRTLMGSSFFTFTDSTEMTNEESIKYFQAVNRYKKYNVLLEPAYYGVYLLIWE